MKDVQRYIALRGHHGYKDLQLLWMQDISDIEAKRDAAASRGQESAWRYWAGLEKGYKKAVMRLELEIESMNDEAPDSLQAPSEKIETLLAEARGEKK